ncbi:hypothetical protein CEXT_430951 [Caerostris extrusa]|uniref:Uncharacterized protein n=1 Tax=Caerostris extrusa TaxID=172846 RepID=A0AAV4WWI7_CAEEX|nr:hypothetical protein CEXT_430951 [Caerostris extrusa]
MRGGESHPEEASLRNLMFLWYSDEFTGHFVLKNLLSSSVDVTNGSFKCKQIANNPRLNLSWPTFTVMLSGESHADETSLNLMFLLQIQPFLDAPSGICYAASANWNLQLKECICGICIVLFPAELKRHSSIWLSCPFQHKYWSFRVPSLLGAHIRRSICVNTFASSIANRRSIGCTAQYPEKVCPNGDRSQGTQEFSVSLIWKTI